MSHYLSANTDAWEQWQLRDLGSGNLRFVSFHGTALFVAGYPASVFHAPFGRNDYFDFSRGCIATPIDYVSDGKIVIGSRCGGTGMQVATDNSGTLTTSPASSGSTTPNTWWTAIEVISPAAGRKTDQVLVMNNSFHLRSYHNTFLRWIHDVQYLAEYYYKYKAYPPSLSVKQDATRDSSAYSSVTAAKPIRYGETIQIKINPWPGYLYFLTAVAGDPQPVAFVFGQGGDWTVVDPSGSHQNGDRVPADTQVALRHTGTEKFLSCSPPPGGPYLTANTNAAAWEFWTFVNP